MPDLPLCARQVRSALDARDAGEIRRLASQGQTLNCLGTDGVPAMDIAVASDQPALVQALLEGQADPNTRWFSHGDMFPLQKVIEARAFGLSNNNRTSIVRLLLEHGADPNARWCPFESRAFPGERGCTSDRGVTPLIMAAFLNMADVVYQLLDAGADPWLADDSGATALDQASGAAVFALLLPAMFPDATDSSRAALEFMAAHEPGSAFQPFAWKQTPLTRALVDFWPCREGNQDCVNSRPGRVRLLLQIGADPNERLRGPIDWTPLAVAIAQTDATSVQLLLDAGADPNLRWCAALDLRSPSREPGCTLDRGTTPLMAATATRSEALVTPALFARLRTPRCTRQRRRSCRSTALDVPVRADQPETAVGAQTEDVPDGDLSEETPSFRSQEAAKDDGDEYDGNAYEDWPEEGVGRGHALHSAE